MYKLILIASRYKMWAENYSRLLRIVIWDTIIDRDFRLSYSSLIKNFPRSSRES